MCSSVVVFSGVEVRRAGGGGGWEKGGFLGGEVTEGERTMHLSYVEFRKELHLITTPANI